MSIEKYLIGEERIFILKNGSRIAKVKYENRKTNESTISWKFGNCKYEGLNDDKNYSLEDWGFLNFISNFISQNLNDLNNKGK